MEHKPTHRRTLSGKLVPITDDRPKGFIELVADHKAKQEKPEPQERTGSFYQQEFAALTSKPVCPHCKSVADPDVECPATDSGNHEVRTHNVNRRMLRAAGMRSGYSQRLAMTLGEVWVSRREK